MRKLQGITVTSEAIASLCKTAVPASAKFSHAYFDSGRNAFVCVFEDESFKDVPEGHYIPVDVDNLRQQLSRRPIPVLRPETPPPQNPIPGYSQTAWYEIPVSEISPEAFGFLGD